ncbi:MAG: GGDEF domain-containing protein [bacterium]
MKPRRQKEAERPSQRNTRLSYFLNSYLKRIVVIATDITQYALGDHATEMYAETREKTNDPIRTAQLLAENVSQITGIKVDLVLPYDENTRYITRDHRIIEKTDVCDHVRIVRGNSNPDDVVAMFITTDRIIPPSTKRILYLLSKQLTLDFKASAEFTQDYLTGLLIRAEFERKVSNLQQQVQNREKAGNRDAEQLKQRPKLILLDIDKFKPFNDTYGHEMGDVVLSLVASMIKRAFREDDIVARYGGEEFYVAADGITFETSLQRLEKLQENVNSIWVVDHNGRKIVAQARQVGEAGNSYFTFHEIDKETLLPCEIPLQEIITSGTLGLDITLTEYRLPRLPITDLTGFPQEQSQGEYKLERRMGISGGVKELDPELGMKEQKNECDLALYVAKACGRRTYTVTLPRNHPAVEQTSEVNRFHFLVEPAKEDNRTPYHLSIIRRDTHEETQAVVQLLAEKVEKCMAEQREFGPDDTKVTITEHAPDYFGVVVNNIPSRGNFAIELNLDFPRKFAESGELTTTLTTMLNYVQKDHFANAASTAFPAINEINQPTVIVQGNFHTNVPTAQTTFRVRYGIKYHDSVSGKRFIRISEEGFETHPLEELAKIRDYVE